MGKEPETGGGGGRERKDTASAQRNVRFVGRGLVADKLLWSEALRKGASAGVPAEPEPSSTKSLKPRPSSACGPGAGFPLSRGPIVPAVARGRKVYVDGLCRRWARGEWGSRGSQAVSRCLSDVPELGESGGEQREASARPFRHPSGRPARSVRQQFPGPGSGLTLLGGSPAPRKHHDFALCSGPQRPLLP